MTGSSARRLPALTVLGLSVAGLLILPFVTGPGTRLVQAVLTGIVPAALVALGAPLGAHRRLVLVVTLVLGVLLSGSLAILVALQASGPVESPREAVVAPVVMGLGLVLLPLAVLSWGFAVASRGPAGGKDRT